MSNLVKPYEISVWEDIYNDDGVLQEVRVGIIGTESMVSQHRALEPTLIRNVNGTKKLSFKMYKHYIDNVTGEQVSNPFVDWLVAERKVKLKYGTYTDANGEVRDKWYDFVVKDINENSADYLYTYSLEDALVQELSKNGFGVTLDAELMNNIGDAGQLATLVLNETDWSVDSEIFVQTIDEALVYVKLPSNFHEYTVYKIQDQTKDNLKSGVSVGDPLSPTVAGQMSEKTILAFYSCCKNKPHRFQFIYNANGYDKDANGNYIIGRKDDRTIDHPNCQYYIDFPNPATNYSTTASGSLGLYLPDGFVEGIPGVNPKDTSDKDTTLSYWYRGKRYGYAEQSMYIPLLERYCNKYVNNTPINIQQNSTLALHYDGTSDSIAWGTYNTANKGFSGSKKANWSGYKFVIPYAAGHTYIVRYDLEVTGGTLLNIGGHRDSFKSYMKVTHDSVSNYTTNDLFTFTSALSSGSKIQVEAKYNKFNNPEDGSPYIFIQPNRGSTTEVAFKITNLSISYQSDYFGYSESEFVSPTLIQNCINNYKFESTTGWYATASTSQSSATKAKVENVYGRFYKNAEDENVFETMFESFYNNTYSEANTYLPYMKMSFYNAAQFVLNSGIKDNRTTIQNMPINEEWVLDYKILNSAGTPVNSQFDFSLGEYIYNTSSGGYNAREGFISFSQTSAGSGDRIIFKVSNSGYTKDTFKKDSKIYLQIKPKSVTEGADGQGGTPDVYYIEKIALYKKSLDANNEIIVPDYEEEESVAAEEYVNQGALNKKYHYFSAWLVDSNNPQAITDKESLPTIVANSLSYATYVPVYNDGARKIRTVTARESNYFNILQSIAETFEAWLELEVKREDLDNPGAITSKIVKFKNYIGADNYANFRYGVNLKDIQRVSSSKNIVTKLIVKQNNNDLAPNGFCTIARAGANPTGENYIYDFQYYQNTGVMNVEEYLNNIYYIDGARGPDYELWANVTDNNKVTQPTTDNPTNLKGYVSRIKKINNALVPINEEIVGLKQDLVVCKSNLEVAKATYEASLTGLETTREDFLALTGVYPEDIQVDDIQEIGTTTITPKEDWWTAGTVAKNGNVLTIPLYINSTQQEVHPKIITQQGTTTTELASGAKEISKSSEWTGLYLEEDWEAERAYTLTYEIQAIAKDGESLVNIGCHNHYFNNNFSIEVKDTSGATIATSANNTDKSVCTKADGSAFSNGTRYLVTVKGKRAAESEYANLAGGDPNLWIQPNRGTTTPVTCKVSNIKLHKTLSASESVKVYDRTAHFYLTAQVTVKNNPNPVTRTYELSCVVPGGQTSVTTTQEITQVDISRSDVQKYITEYTLFFEKKESSSADKITHQTQVTNKENAIKAKEARVKQLLAYKNELNKLFFTKYSRFILEGTWMSEEYVDDDKYYADAQSVMYNSCYPQVSYEINVLSLQGVPGYELIDFDLGDKTNVVDEQFFGSELQEEVIVSETTETLGDPSKNTIRVQNFKNQFQDLFQTITATVQQAQYNSGSYEKGAALAEANEEHKNEFVTNAINSASTFLQFGQTVDISDTEGITITDHSDKQNRLRLVGGAILFSTTDPKTQEQTWMTGVTNQGISASLITTGRLDAGAVQIMSGDEPTFRWDAHGLSAYDAHWTSAGGINTISGIDSKKFVRFDKNGIYGINNYPGIDGANWHPNSINEVHDRATFALTWDGLKVTGGEGGTAHLGRMYNPSTETSYIMTVKNSDQKDTFRIDEDGNVHIGGNLHIGPISENNTVQGAINDTKNYAENLVENLEIGGRNLLVGTKNPNSWECTTFTNGEAYKENAKTSEDFIYYGRKGGGTVSLESDQFYTLSFEAKGSDVNPCEVFILQQNYNASMVYPLNYSFGTPTSSYQRYTVTFKPDTRSTGLDHLYIRFDNNGALSEGKVGKLYIKNVKLEKGTKATDWTPAPEDVENDIQSTEDLINATAADLKDQIDKQLETYFYPHIPTINNEPAKDWTEDKYSDRNGDLFYITSPGGKVHTSADTPTNVAKDDYWIVSDTVVKKYDGQNWQEVEASESEVVRQVGACYRWQYTAPAEGTSAPSETNYWFRIADTGLEKALADAARAQATADGKMTVFYLDDMTEEKIQEYFKDRAYQTGDLWVNAKYGDTYNNDLLRCSDGKEVGDAFNINHWMKATNYTDDAELNAFINGDYTQFIDNITEQVDQKSDIYYQDKDPSGADWGENRVGDLWRCTAVIKDGETVIRKANSEWVWRKNSDKTYGWHHMEIPDNVFDEYDGRAQLYTSAEPTDYQVNDLWITPVDITINNTKHPSGTLLVATETSETFDKTHWAEKTRYTDDSYAEGVKQSFDAFKTGYKTTLSDINKQLDKKAETWYQSKDPAGYEGDDKWGDDHVGDLWYNSSKDEQTISIWQAVGNSYGWVKTKAPKEIFDKIDGKAAIYTTLPADAIYQVNDLLIPAANFTSEESTYKANKVYRYTKFDDDYIWQAVDYTDSEALNSLETTLKGDYGAQLKSLSGEIETRTEVVTDTIENDDGTKTKTITIGGQEISRTIYSADERYVITNVGTRAGTQAEDHSSNYFEISTDGLLTADNAIIHGTIFANAGQIGGMAIGQLVGRAEQIVGKNLLKGSSEYREANAYALTPTTDDRYVYLENLSAILKANVTYTIACVTDGLWSGHATSGSGRDRFCTLWLKDSRGNHTCFGGNAEETGHKSWTYTPTADDTYVIRVNTYGEGNSTVKFWDFKIEEGSIATPWCLSDEDAVQTSVNTNEFSWKFSPSEGMFMWNGAQGTGIPSSDTNLVFKIGPKESGGGNELFMRGHIEATSGKIGNMEIGQLLQNANQNLFNPDFLQTVGVASYQPLDDKNGWNMAGGLVDRGSGIKFTGSTFILNQQYVLTCKFKKNGGSELKNVGVWPNNGAYETTKFVVDGHVDGQEQTDVDGQEQTGILVELKNDTEEHTVEWHFQKVKTSDSDISIGININGGMAIAFNIWDVKLELGDVATAWTPYTAGATTNMTGDFSWKFSPTEGMFMWNGAQGTGIPSSDTNLVFKIGPKESGGGNELFMRGHIEAESGSIGGFQVADLSSTDASYGKGLYKMGANNATSGMTYRGASADGDSVVFWAGCPGGTPWEVQDYDENTPFIVLENGNVKCSNIEITGGSFSGGSIKEASIGNTTITEENGVVSIMAQSGDLCIGGGGATITFKQDAKIDSSYTIRTRAVQNTSNTNIWKFRMECVNQNGDLIPSPITIDHEDLYYERYIGGSLSNDTGYMGISLSLSAGKTTGGWVQKQFTLNWFNSDEVRVFNDSNKGPYITLKTDTSGQPELTLNLRTGDLNNSPYYMSCALNLYPNACATGAGGVSLGTKTNYWYQICGYDLFYKNGYAGIDASDERIKNSIEVIPEQYELFFDNMKPTRYKYNNGESNRYHTGFIAQSLVRALEKSGLTTQDFAGVVLYHPGEEDEQWYLRRDEFVALNTWQIQKLKPRVSTLEQAIIDYETRISNLETEIQNLKSR